MNIQCRLIIIGNPADLPSDVLPSPDIKFGNCAGEIPNLDILKALIDGFNKNGDRLLDGIFSPFLRERALKIPVVVTRGICEPYDAWCTNYSGQRTVFFNLSLWTADDLKKSGLAVIIHEISHVLLAEAALKMPDTQNPLEILERLVFDEGIAHFIGFPGDREKLLTDYKEKWPRAEAGLKEAIAKLSNLQISKKEKEEILTCANTGSFWDKYASIAGLFRAANIYRTKGAPGLVDCIKGGQLPDLDENCSHCK